MRSALVPLLCLAACTAPDAPKPAVSHRARAQIVLRVDPGQGTVTPLGASERGLHVPAPVVQDGDPGNNPAGTFQVVTSAARLPGEGTCPATDNCFDVRIDSFLGRDAAQVTLVVDAVSPLRTMSNPDPAPPGSGLASALGIAAFGDIGAGGASALEELRFTVPNLDPYTVTMTLYELDPGAPADAGTPDSGADAGADAGGPSDSGVAPDSGLGEPVGWAPVEWQSVRTGSGTAYEPAVSADGRFVAFSSGSPSLVAGDNNGAFDVFVRDRWTGVIARVSVSSAGVEGSAHSESPSISADGRFVAFFSSAPNLVAGDTNSTSDVFVRDRELGTTVRVSVAPGGAQANGASVTGRRHAISADGRFVVFSSNADNLAPSDLNASSDVFVRDLWLGTTSLVSAAPDDAPAGGSAAAISGARSCPPPRTSWQGTATSSPTCSSTIGRPGSPSG